MGWGTRGRTTPGHRPQRIVVAVVLTVCGFALAASSAAAADFTWSGAAAPGTASWSDPTNWEGATAPSGSVGTLTFPRLTGAACVANPATATCYTSTNDVSGLNVNALSIDDGVPYNITGNAIILGAGGITASPSANDVGLHPVLSVPITLSAPQTWSISRANGGLNEGLEVNANISGAVSDTLGINFGTSYAFFGITADAEVGAVTVTGSGALALGALASGAGGAVQGSLNGTNGNPVGLGLATFLVALDGATGPLTVGEVASLQVGEPGPAQGTSGTLAVNGGVTFNSTNNIFFSFIHPGTVAGTNYSQLRASGAVSLNGATLRLSDGESSACEVLTPGNVDTLITTTGLLTGTFHGVPDGTIISAECFAAGTAPTVKINYTAHAVTATVETAGSSGKGKATATGLQASNANPSVGETVTYTATVTPETPAAFEPIGSVTFLDNGSAIAACSAQPLTQGLSSSTATCQVSYAAAGSHSITATYLADANFTGSTSSAQTVTVQPSSSTGGGEGGGSTNTATTATSTSSGQFTTVLPEPPPAPSLAQRQGVTVLAGTVTVRLRGTSTFVPLSGSTSIPDGSEVDATNGRVVITAATPTGKTVSAEVYGGRFRVHQDSSGVTHVILSLPLTGCPRVALPRGSAAAVTSRAKRRAGPKSRHVWVSEHGGSWATNGRYVSTSVVGTTWLTLDECTRSLVKVTAGKVKVRDLAHKRTKSLTAGRSYTA